MFGFGAVWRALEARRFAGQVVEQMRHAKRIGLDRASPKETIPISVSGRYLISTDAGLYHLAGNELQRISRLPCFGMACDDDRIYLATWKQDRSLVVSAPFRQVVSEPGRRDWKQLWSRGFNDFAGRLHQISLCGDSLWLANTAQNCLTKIDAHTGAWKANIAPFRCSFGHPIMQDHNHVNGVVAGQNWLVFTAFKAFKRSAFGVCGDGKLRIFTYRNMGAHDCAFDGNSFVFTDSYSFWDDLGHGMPIRDGIGMMPAFFKQHAARFVRGVAGGAEECLVGNSFTGSREDRFSGRGDIFVLREAESLRLEMPAAQIYDILRVDGRHFEALPTFQNATEISNSFETLFGPPVEEMDLEDMQFGPNVKTFDDRDQGAIAELL